MRSEGHVVFPDLSIAEFGDLGAARRLEIRNHTFGTRVEGSPDLRQVLDAFRTPRRLESFEQEYDVPDGLLAELRRAFVLVPAEDVESLRLGLASPAHPPIGRPLRVTELDRVDGDGAYAVIGAAVDALGFPGGRGGPAAIRRAFPQSVRPSGPESPAWRLADLDLRRLYPEAQGLRCYDLGDVHGVGDSMASVGRRIGWLVRAARSRSMCPVLLGGDHSVTWFALEALLPTVDRLAIVHLDAHPDLYPARPARLTHGNPFRFALRDRKVERIVQIGLRTFERFDDRLALLDEPRLTCVTALEAESASAEEVLAAVRPDVPCYLSFDVDVMAPEVAPETGTPVPGGLGYATALRLVDHVARHLPVVGADFVEVLDRGTANRAAAVAARLLAQLLLGRLPFTALTSYYSAGDGPNPDTP